MDMSFLITQNVRGHIVRGFPGVKTTCMKDYVQPKT